MRNRNILNGMKEHAHWLFGRLRLVIPSVKCIGCCGIFQSHKNHFEIDFSVKCHKIHILHKPINRKVYKRDNCNADYSNNSNSSWTFVKSLLITVLIVAVAIFALWLFCFHAIFYTTKVYCWSIRFDSSRCISINKNIMFDSIELGWVELSSFNYCLPFSKKIIRIMYAYPVHTSSQYIWSQL